MRPLRRLMDKLEALEEVKGESAMELGAEEVRLDPVSQEDVLAALEATRPSAHAFADKYDKWQREFGST